MHPADPAVSHVCLPQQATQITPHRAAEAAGAPGLSAAQQPHPLLAKASRSTTTTAPPAPAHPTICANNITRSDRLQRRRSPGLP